MGLDVIVVSGITAGLAAATSIGEPLTHRDHAHGVIFVTGHARRDAEAGALGATPTSYRSPHWPTLAAAAAEGLTLVIYMGIATVESLQCGLATALPPNTPVAIVQHASLPQQRSVLCTLGDLATTVQREAIGSPAIIVVGDVVKASLLLAERAAQPERARRAS